MLYKHKEEWNINELKEKMQWKSLLEYRGKDRHIQKSMTVGQHFFLLLMVSQIPFLQKPILFLTVLNLSESLWLWFLVRRLEFERPLVQLEVMVVYGLCVQVDSESLRAQ